MGRKWAVIDVAFWEKIGFQDLFFENQFLNHLSQFPKNYLKKIKNPVHRS